jgi:hypothetical protein
MSVLNINFPLIEIGHIKDLIDHDSLIQIGHIKDLIDYDCP